MPQLRKPEYYALRELTQVLKAEQVEVFAVLLRLGAQLWDTPAGRQQLVEDLATSRTQAPGEANVPPISIANQVAPVRMGVSGIGLLNR